MTDRELLGIPIKGEKPRDYGRVKKEQKSPTLLIDAINAALAIEGVESVRWTQYVPSFNDGDPCVFTVSDATFRREGKVDYEEDYDLYSHRKFPDGRTDYTPRYFESENDEKLYDAMRALRNELYGGHHEDILQEKFGIGAEIIASKKGFQIEVYDCGY